MDKSKSREQQVVNNILLSICISSYNRGDRCFRLVQSILSIESDKYNIFICDDHSDKNEFQKLEKIHNPKVTILQNISNQDPCKNWYNTINCGNGKYILHLLDRDIISIQNLKILIDILEQYSVGVGYIGKSAMRLINGIKRQNNVYVCKKGKEAFLVMAGVPIHPTGFLINREYWQKDKFQKFFFYSDKYGIYPHSYILGEVALKKDTLFMPVTFCRGVYGSSDNHSRFYKKENQKDFWWMPDNVIKTANQLILYLSRIAEETYKEEFVCRRFQEGLNRATIGYKRTVQNVSEMKRYGLHITRVTICKQIMISLKFKLLFIYILKKTETYNKKVRKQLMDAWLENIVEIIKEG